MEKEKAKYFDFNVDQEFASKLFCPFCAEKLIVEDSWDSWKIGLLCTNAHKFTIPKKVALAGSTNSDFGSNSNRHSVANTSLLRKWLQEDTYRAKLNDQLADVLRRIAEESLDANFGHETFAYCPICRAQLHEIQEDDVWTNKLKCENRHEFHQRGANLNFIVKGTNYRLCSEMSKADLIFVIDGWLSDNGSLKNQLHPELIPILQSARVELQKV